jgi:hypothetical protein
MAIAFDIKAQHVVVELPCTAKRWVQSLNELHEKWWFSLSDKEQRCTGPDSPVPPAIAYAPTYPAIINGKLAVPCLILCWEKDRQKIAEDMRQLYERELEDYRQFMKRGEQQMTAEEKKKMQSSKQQAFIQGSEEDGL